MQVRIGVVFTGMPGTLYSQAPRWGERREGPACQNAATDHGEKSGCGLARWGWLLHRAADPHVLKVPKSADQRQWPRDLMRSAIWEG
jgi:hypothetical protein